LKIEEKADPKSTNIVIPLLGISYKKPIHLLADDPILCNPPDSQNGKLIFCPKCHAQISRLKKRPSCPSRSIHPRTSLFETLFKVIALTV
jgi:hypothetical protein